MNFSQFITKALQETATIAHNNFGKVKGTTKPGDNNQVLTETDVEIGKRIIHLIQENFPDHNIIDEEAGVIDKNSDFTWVVDPIDGTSNFANGVPTYGIMIGLLKGDTPISGGVSLPEFQEIYTAEKNSGTFCNGQKINVTSETKLASLLVAYGIDGHQENPQFTYDESKTLAHIVLNIRNLRSSNSVFDLAMLIKGKYGASLNQTSKIWDNVAPHILVEEAGGKYTSFDGKKMEYSQPLERSEQNFTFCAAAPILHEQLQRIISQTA